MADSVRELRLAVSMVGGSSLAVHIHGTAQELEAFARAEGIYGSLAQVTRTKPVIDILSGTSAGGINAVFLATALTNGTSMKIAEQVFKEKADLDELLHPMGFCKKGGPSILQGDAVLHDSLKNVFAKLLETEECSTKAEDIDLFVTGTFLQGYPQTYFGDAGTRIYSKQHQAVFHFRRHHQRNDFCGSNKRAGLRLARAARTTASLPAIFEVSEVNQDFRTLSSDAHLDPPIIELPNLDKIWMGDGGYLNNRPLNLVIKSIARKPVQKLPVDRRVVLVEPTPDSLDVMKNDAQGPDPLSHVRLCASISMSQSLYGLLEQTDYHNRNVKKVQRALAAARESFKGDRSEVSEQQKRLFVSISAEAIKNRLRELWAAKMGVSGVDLVGGANPTREHRERRDMAIQLENVCQQFEDQRLTGLMQGDLAKPKETDEKAERRLSQYDILALERKIVWLIDDLYQTFENALRSQDSEKWEIIFKNAYLLYDKAQKLLRQAEIEYREAAKQKNGKWFYDDEVLKAEIKLEDADWDELTENLGKEFTDVRHVTRLESYLNHLFASSLTLDLKDARGLMLAPDGKLSGDEEQGLFEGYLKWLDVHLFPIEYAAELQFHQPLKVVMIDPFEKLGLSGLVSPDHKVAGDTLMKFGGFLRHTWRVNDILWGRIDASSKLIKIMLEMPEMELSKKLAFLKKRWEALSEALELKGDLEANFRLLQIVLAEGKGKNPLTEPNFEDPDDYNWALCHVVAGQHHLQLVRELLPELMASDIVESNKIGLESNARRLLIEEGYVLSTRSPKGTPWEIADLTDELRTQLKAAPDGTVIRFFAQLNFGEQSAADLPRLLNIQRGLNFTWSTLQALRHSKGEFPVKHFYKLFRPIELGLVSLSKMITHPILFGLGSLLLFLGLVAWTAYWPTWPIADGQGFQWTFPAGVLLILFGLVKGAVDKPLPEQKVKTKGSRYFLLGLLFLAMLGCARMTHLTKPMIEPNDAHGYEELFQPDGWPGTGIVPLQFAGTPERAESIVKIWERREQIDTAIVCHTWDYGLIVCYMALGALGFYTLAGLFRFSAFHFFAHCTLLAGALDLMETFILLRVIEKTGESLVPLVAFLASLKFALLWPFLGALIALALGVLWSGVKLAFR